MLCIWNVNAFKGLFTLADLVEVELWPRVDVSERRQIEQVAAFANALFVLAVRCCLRWSGVGRGGVENFKTRQERD